jgi:hypothetical protein
MHKVFAETASAFVVVVAMSHACGGSSSSTANGGLRQPCYGNGTCNAGLTCASDVCVVIGDAGVDASSGASSSPDAASSGAPDSGATGETDSPSSGTTEAGADAAGPEAAVTADSCLSWKIAGSTTDGNYAISIGGKGVSVWCHGLATSAPAEYLSVASGSNYSTLIDHCTNGSTTTVTFTKVRLDLSPLAIDRTDLTFAMVTADGGAPTTDARFLRYAIGGACDSSDLSSAGSVTGQGKLDLSGTGFQLAAGDMFVATGYMATCMAAISTDKLSATLLGGGYSGWCDVPPIGPAPSGSNTLPVALTP